MEVTILPTTAYRRQPDHNDDPRFFGRWRGGSSDVSLWLGVAGVGN